MIATTFTNWQQKPAADLAKFRVPAPALTTLRAHVLAEFGGVDLGIYGVRNSRGRKSLSSHAFGSAWDWSYRGMNREVADRLIAWLIEHSAELGIQAIHDYLRSRIWRANRSGDKNGGWQKQRADKEGMGQTWGDWIHVEVNERQWNDGRSVNEKIGPPPRPVLKVGDRNDYVRIVQAVLRDKAGQAVTVDGKFGAQTETAVKNVEAFLKMPPDGVVDAAFWSVIDTLVKQ